MTYCLAIKVNEGLVFASDSRTHAGVDYANVYSKVHRFRLHDDRLIVLLGAGSLATTQAVVNQLEQDLMDPGACQNLNAARTLFDAASYLGAVSVREQGRHWEAMQRSGFSAEATFILGGQIRGQAQEAYLIYPQGNCITAPPLTPFLQIGESKYGKPILSRIIEPSTPLEDAARCALVSLDSTMKSNISVGLPVDLLLYRRDSLIIEQTLNLDLASPYYAEFQQRWSSGIRAAFDHLPRFEWEC